MASIFHTFLCANFITIHLSSFTIFDENLFLNGSLDVCQKPLIINIDIFFPNLNRLSNLTKILRSFKTPLWRNTEVKRQVIWGNPQCIVIFIAFRLMCNKSLKFKFTYFYTFLFFFFFYKYKCLHQYHGVLFIYLTFIFLTRMCVS